MCAGMAARAELPPSAPARTVVDAILARADGPRGDAVALRWIAAAPAGGQRCVDVTYRALVHAACTAAAHFPPLSSDGTGGSARAGASSSSPVSSPSSAAAAAATATAATASPPCIGVMVEEGPALAVLELAVMVAGHALVPLSAHDPPSRLRCMLEDADVRAAVAPDAAAARRLREAQVSPFPILLAADVVDSASLETGRGDNGATGNNDTTASRPTPPPMQRPRPAAAAVSHVFFTSGSTGKPKGCLATHAALLSYCQAKNTAHDVDANSVVFVASPHTFDPSLGDFFATWVAGGTAACAPRADTFAALGRCLVASKCTHCLTTPALLGTMPAGPPPGLRLQVVALGGEATSRALLSAWAPHVDRILNTYGTTECVVYQTVAVLHDAMDHNTIATTADPRRLGRPLAGNTLHFVAEPGDDPAKLAVEGSGELAELWIGGAQVGLGYLNRPELTRARFQFHHPPPPLPPPPAPTLPGGGGGGGGGELFQQPSTAPVLQPLFRTGDVVKMAPGGALLLGRRDAQVKLNGQRVELGEVEAALLRAAGPGLLQSAAAVVLKPASAGSKIAARLVAWCVPGWTEGVGDATAASSRGGGRRPDIEVPALYHDALRWLAARELPLHMVPSQLGFLASLPLTGTGKVARRPLLRRGGPVPPCVSAAADAAPTQETHGPVAEAVGRIWSEVLGLPPRLHVDGEVHRVHFVEMGGDSLAALRACQRLSALIAEAAPAGSGGTDHDTTTTFAGEAMGCLGPAELLKRPRLADYVRYLRQEVECWPASLVEKDAGESGESGGEQKGAKDKDSGDGVGGDEGLRLLYGAAAAGAAHLVSRLLAYGLPVEGGSCSLTPLHAACANGHAEAVRALLAAGALCNAPNSHGATPLLLASGAAAPGKAAGKKAKALSGSAGVLSLVSCLLEAGASLAQTDSSGQSVLHAAARSGQSRAVLNALLQGVRSQTGSRARALRAKGPMPLWKDKWGRTPLHWAAVNGHRGCCAYLLRECESAGAESAKVRDGAGETPLDAAERRALCSAAARPDGARSSVWGDIATLLGGAGTTKHLKAKLKH